MLPLIHSAGREKPWTGDVRCKPLEVRGAPVKSSAVSLAFPQPGCRRLVSRAKTCFCAPMGSITRRSPKRLGPAAETVGKWRVRFRTQGLMGLYDERRPGKPRSIEDDEVMVLLRKTLDTEACRRQHALEPAVPWPTRRGCPSPTVHRVWKAFISNLIARSTSSSPPIRSSSRRSTISSDSTSTQPATRWCSASTRRARPRRSNPASAAPWARIRRRRHAWLIRQAPPPSSLDVALSGQILAQCPRHRHRSF